MAYLPLNELSLESNTFGIIMNNTDNGTLTIQDPSYDSYYSFDYYTWYYAEPIWLQILFIFLFAIISVLGVGGNVIVCYIVLGDRRMRTVTNYFIANLAISDILMAAMCVNFTFYATMYLQWPFGILMCKLVMFTQSVSVSVSIFTIVAISLDRYTAIIHPLSPRMTATSTLLVVIFIWVLASLFALPSAMYATVIYGGNMSYCSEGNWRHAAVYSIIAMVVQYFLPLSILLFAYGRIGHTIWARRTPGEGDTSRDSKMRESKTKLVKMFATVVLLFALCYIPIHVFVIIQDIYPAIHNFPFIKIVFLSILLVAMSNCVYNPFIYCYMNQKFRNGFRAVFRFLPCVRYDPELGSYTGLRRNNTLHTENVSMTSRISHDGRIRWATDVSKAYSISPTCRHKQLNGYGRVDSGEKS